MGKFVKNVENFVCEHCNYAVTGTGYTNHCPRCLWSKHVDINPGDRAATCLGMMEPFKVEHDSGEDVLFHRCLKCGHKKRNKVSPKDDYDSIVQVAKRAAERKPL